MAKWLVTGATGFVGANLIATLVERGENVYAIIRKKSNLQRIAPFFSQLGVFIGDLREEEFINHVFAKTSPDIIVHAAVYGGLPFQNDYDLIMQTNCMSTYNIFKVAYGLGKVTLINLGSSSEYGLKDHPMHENDFLEPRTLYGITKAFSTLLCSHYGRDLGLNCCTLRLFSPYGPGEDAGRLIPTLMKAVVNRERPRLASPTSVRDFVYIRDVIEAIFLAANKENLQGIILNVGSGVQHSVKEVVETLSKVSGVMLSPIWRVNPGRTGESSTWVADITRTKSFLQWKPKTSLEEGLGLTLEDFRRYTGGFE